MVTNIVLAQATAFIADGSSVNAAGNVMVAASNAAQLDATASSVVEGKKQTVGFILAFNTVGWKAQNVLFNTVDALIGSPEVADAFGNEQAARAEARRAADALAEVPDSEYTDALRALADFATQRTH